MNIYFRNNLKNFDCVLSVLHNVLEINILAHKAI